MGKQRRKHPRRKPSQNQLIEAIKVEVIKQEILPAQEEELESEVQITALYFRPRRRNANYKVEAISNTNKHVSQSPDKKSRNGKNIKTISTPKSLTRSNSSTNSNSNSEFNSKSSTTLECPCCSINFIGQAALSNHFRSCALSNTTAINWEPRIPLIKTEANLISTTNKRVYNPNRKSRARKNDRTILTPKHLPPSNSTTNSVSKSDSSSNSNETLECPCCSISFVAQATLSNHFRSCALSNITAINWDPQIHLIQTKISFSSTFSNSNDNANLNEAVVKQENVPIETDDSNVSLMENEPQAAQSTVKLEEQGEQQSHLNDLVTSKSPTGRPNLNDNTGGSDIENEVEPSDPPPSPQYSKRKRKFVLYSSDEEEEEEADDTDVHDHQESDSSTESDSDGTSSGSKDSDDTLKEGDEDKEKELEETGADRLPIELAFRCPFPDCLKIFPSGATLADHVEETHKPIGNVTTFNPRPFNCPWKGCTRSFSRAFSMDPHIKNIHMGKAPPKRHPSIRTRTQPQAQNQQPIFALRKDAPLDQSKGSIPVKPVRMLGGFALISVPEMKCPVSTCTRTFSSTESYLRHVKAHDKPPLLSNPQPTRAKRKQRRRVAKRHVVENGPRRRGRSKQQFKGNFDSSDTASMPALSQCPVLGCNVTNTQQRLIYHHLVVHIQTKEMGETEKFTTFLCPLCENDTGEQDDNDDDDGPRSKHPRIMDEDKLARHLQRYHLITLPKNSKCTCKFPNCAREFSNLAVRAIHMVTHGLPIEEEEDERKEPNHI